jgi:alpha-methylacyl-CoA racemase
VTLRGSPGLALADGAEKETNVAVRAAKGQGVGVPGEGWESKGMSPGVGGEETLEMWLGWKKGRQYDVVGGGLVKKESGKL